MKILFWTTTKLNEEDWFIIADNEQEACTYHEDHEGFERGVAKAKIIQNVDKDYESKKTYHAQLDMLSDMGFLIISRGPNRIVSKDGRIYQEGTVIKLAILERSYGREGLYIISMTGTNIFKIGITKDFTRRMKNLQTGNPNVLEVHHFYPMPAHRNAESFLHKKYKNKNIGGEWFVLTQSDLDNIHNYVISHKKGQ